MNHSKCSTLRLFLLGILSLQLEKSTMQTFYIPLPTSLDLSPAAYSLRWAPKKWKVCVCVGGGGKGTLFPTADICPMPAMQLLRLGM